MQHLIDHARSFPVRAASRGTELSELAHGQFPHALFMTCSDSRVIPSLITNASPGELFELRTAGNIAPVYGEQLPAGEAATIEYAVSVLGVTDLIVCGHSHCGAVGAMVRGEDLSAIPDVRDWLDRAAPVPPSQTPELSEAVQANVLEQLERLRSYPCIADRLADRRLRLHGWYYEVHTGSVLAHQPHADAFLPL